MKNYCGLAAKKRGQLGVRLAFKNISSVGCAAIAGKTCGILRELAAQVHAESVEYGE